MPDKWSTFKVNCQGGLVQNEDVLDLAENFPGAAADLVNFEGDLRGGYRRVSGYDDYAATAVPTAILYATSAGVSGAGLYGAVTSLYGTSGVTAGGAVLGVQIYLSGAIAARGEHIFYAIPGGAWAMITTSGVGLGIEKYRFADFQWTVPSIIMTNGVGYAIHYSGSALTHLSTSGAPTNPKFCEEFKQHIFLAGYSSNPNAIRHSAPNSYTDFSALNGAGEIVVGDEIVNIKKIHNDLLIFCKRSLYRLVGNNVFDWQLQKISSNIGSIAPDSIQEYNNDLMFLAPDGIRTVAETEKIGDTELGVLSKPVGTAVTDIINTYSETGSIASVVVRAKGQYRMFGSLSTLTTATQQGILASRVKEQPAVLEWGKLLGFDAYCADSGYISKTEYVLHGARDGGVYKQEYGNSFNGSNVYALYVTPQWTFGDPTIRKTLYKLNTYYRLEGNANVTVGTVLDYNDSSVLQPPNVSFTSQMGVAIYGSAIYGTDIYGGNNFPVTKTNLIGSGHTAGLIYTSNDINPPYSINAIVLQYGTNARR